jgi:hypothetical protein
VALALAVCVQVLLHYQQELHTQSRLALVVQAVLVHTVTELMVLILFLVLLLLLVVLQAEIIHN